MTTKKKVISKPHMPMVSVCTPTFNRRPFIPILFECFKNQTYPKSRIEWIIIDDGTDKIQDLIETSNIPQIKYFNVDKKMTLGAKRNMLHEKSSGSILVYMDDDDYYPPERISHAVETLMANPKALCAGCSEIYLYFKHIKSLYQFGPYNNNHATAATFAIRKSLIDISKYDDDASIAEERKFLKDYTIPFVQLDPLKTILVFSHEHNSFDKRTLLKNPNKFVKKSNKNIEMFIKNSYENNIKKFFMEDIDKKLKEYLLGKPSMKPDVLEQMNEIQKQREKMFSQQNEQHKIMMSKPGEEPIEIGLIDAVNIINQQQQQMKQLLDRIIELEKIVVELQKEKIVKQDNTKNVSFSENLIQPSFHTQKKHEEELEILRNEINIKNMIEELEILRNEINIKNMIEEKLQSQIQVLIKKNTDLEKSIESFQAPFPIKFKSKIYPEVDISIFNKSLKPM